MSTVYERVNSSWRWWRTAVCLALVLLFNVGGNPLQAQDEPPATPPDSAESLATAQTLLDNMSVAERVGQLFLVTFEGDQATLESDIADLITNYHIGGVVLSAANDNITGYGDPTNIPSQTAELTRNLQSLALRGEPILAVDVDEVEEGAVPPTPEPIEPFTPIPLFIGVAHEGDGYPNSTILSGLTDVPSNMAIGATWQPELAQQVGQVVGEELTSLGINMLFGPSLDVVENPDPFSPSDLGVRSFGGDPYWVGVMGSAYTAGVHIGSQNQIAVIPKHFPGFGASDRPLHEEVPTVRKSLEQLRQIELAPFFAVTGAATRPEAIADGLLTTHIRYQGFQGNIRATTNPVSLDPLALSALMAQEELSIWRDAGGLIVSDALGVRAVERFYGQQQGFPHRVVAKDAFLAGNDLLYLSEFAQEGAPYADELLNIIDTILWFQERYITDVAFQQQVDTAVLRILQLKLRLHNDSFEPDTILENMTVAENIVSSERGQAITIEVAQAGLTLIAPDPEELAERLVQPPSSGEQILIFTDMRDYQQCGFCEPQPLIGLNAIEDQMLALYGPQASAQLQPDQISSHSFADLQAFIDAGPDPIFYNTVPLTPTVAPDSSPTPEDGPTATPLPTATPPPEFLVQEDLRTADWIIFAMLDRTGANSLALNNFLAQRPDLVRDQRVVVFAFNAPYYLDSTEITQLAALFGLYSHNEAAIDTAVRALFQELPFGGASPVNVAGASYDLFLQTQPAANQVIGLDVTDQDGDASAGDEPFAVSVGDTLRLQTGVILDNNGNPVPDGTVVRFVQRDRVAGLVNIIDEIPTINGQAQLDYVLEARTEGGQFRIVAESGAALISQEVDITVGATESGGGAQISIIDPTPQPTPSITPSPSPTATATASPTNSPEPTSTSTQAEPLPVEPGIRIELSEFWLLTAVFAGILISSGAAFSLGRQQNVALAQQIGWPLWTIVGGLLTYIYFQLGLPGTNNLGEMQIGWGFLTSFVGGLAGLILYWLRQKLRI
ncbi:glycoside hydrolase family 3 N-terminal domain-containing protein [Candidatus Leptofilum sp.]|uniref:glycoside hydrolase family 3 N-terminal domain-containing protein n=1 Tax=Candidatus Leptofilum sp. TaxID=3241576 RepID=UPI003B5CF8AD